MKNQNRSISRALLLAAAWGWAAAGTPVHAQTQAKSPYMTDNRGDVVRNSTYLCWHTGFWTPAAAIAECDPDLVAKPPVAAKPAAAQPSARQAPHSPKSAQGRARNRGVEVEVVGTGRQ